MTNKVPNRLPLCGVTFSVAVFGDKAGQDSHVDERALAWFREAVARCQLPDIEVMTWPGVPLGEDRRVTTLICPPGAGHVFGAPDALGLFLLETPDGDPFGDGCDYANAIRVAIMLDIAAIRARLAREIREDGPGWEAYLAAYEAAEASTIFHEIAHAALFMANSGFSSPSAVERGARGHDLFDMVTGYGIRDLEIDGVMSEAEDATSAHALAEEWWEVEGARMLDAAFPGRIGFYEAVGIDPVSVARDVFRDEPSL